MPKQQDTGENPSDLAPVLLLMFTQSLPNTKVYGIPSPKRAVQTEINTIKMQSLNIVMPSDAPYRLARLAQAKVTRLKANNMRI